ncbi:MAG TPA: VWA domain-containing protein [Nitrosopumilaceae archaeon]|nr:VWA domain-containing protein [Nitrosopumilaceae archaeon]
MSRPNTGNFVYYLSDGKKKNTKFENTLSDKKLGEILHTLSKYSMKEKTPEFEELESILQNSLHQNENQDNEIKMENDKNIEDGGASLTKLLKEKGYLREGKKWLTHKGFFKIGGKILHDVMKELNSSDVGLHETKFIGGGNILMDTTKKFEPGNDFKFLSVPQTLLNTIKRISKINHQINFPVEIILDDLEEFETFEDVRVDIVYCIDLSSTMKYSIGKNDSSRIEAAKKALWGLYILNKKFYPNDTISIVGFGSMASLIDPYDIPFLKTFDANDDFLHYTNYQAALRLARKILQKSSAENKRIVMITDGQPSACFIDNIHQKNDIISEKPYSNFYTPSKDVISKIKKERDLKLDINEGSLVYLCYRYKKVDSKINDRTIMEAKKCKREAINIDTIVVGEEEELLKYAQELEQKLKGKTYHINQENMEQVLVHDYLTKTRKVLSSKQIW